MDNFQIKVMSTGKEDFALALKIAFKHSKCTGYRIDEKKGLILMWAAWTDFEGRKDYVKLPYQMDLQQTIDFAWGWLQATPPDGSEPDHDGDNSKGFMIYTESWAQVDSWQEFVAIKPIWAMYGK